MKVLIKMNRMAESKKGGSSSGSDTTQNQELLIGKDKPVSSCSSTWRPVSGVSVDTISDQGSVPQGSKLADFGPSHIVVAEEYMVGVPLFRPKPEFLNILRKGGAASQYEIFTKKEICQFLKEYIGSRYLYNPYDPGEVNCGHDELGKVFGVQKFTIKDVLHLIHKNCYQVPDTCIKRKEHLVVRPISQKSSQSATKEVFMEGEVMSDPCSSTVPSFPIDEQTASQPSTSAQKPPSPRRRNRRKRPPRPKKSPVSTPPSASVMYSESENPQPWYVKVKMETDSESENLSLQSADAPKVEDSPDDLWFLDDPPTFSVEYELESDHTDIIQSDTSSLISGKDVLVVCEDSDMEFWADSSEESDDTELTDEDKWTCECNAKNIPLQRHCSVCWKLRPGWLPEENARKRKQLSKVKDLPKRRKYSGDCDTDTSLDEKELSQGGVDSGICSSQETNKGELEIRRTHLNYQSLSTKEELCETKPEKILSNQNEEIPVVKTAQLSDLSREKKSNTKTNSVMLSTDFASITSSASEPCVICLVRPKTGSIIHGTTGHQVCCFRCARRLKRQRKTCPVCRRHISKVIKNFLL